MQFSYIKFELLGLKEQVEQVQDFLLNVGEMQKDVADYFKIDLNELKKFSKAKQKQYTKDIITELFNKYKDFMQDKIFVFQKLWDKHEKTINKEYEKIFGCKFNGIKVHIAYVNMNCVCPRYLSDESFCVNAWSDDEWLITTCIHELIHFYWFELFKKVFPKTPKSHFECPYPEWELSEIAVDAIVQSSKLKNFYKQYRPAYDSFYESEEIDIIRNLYKNNKLYEFMKKGLDFYKNRNKQ